MKLLLPLLLMLPFGSDRVVVRPKDTGAALINPDMGWVLHYYDNSLTNYGSRLAPSDTLDDFPGLSTVYLRLAWSFIEPEEGRFDWSVVDGPAQRWIAKGKRIAFRFTTSEGHPAFATPQWVQKAGAKGHHFRGDKGVDETAAPWEPDFDDPVFLRKLDNFLAAAAARYDGSPDVAFVDVGSFGIWGEGHTFASTRLNYPGAVVRRHIDLYRKHFKHTLLAANDDFAGTIGGAAVIDYARKLGLTLRDDSILFQCGSKAYLSAPLAQGFWPNVPVILESDHYGDSRERGCWGDGGKYLEALEAYHASYASIHWWPREFLETNRALINRMNRRLGYRIQVTEASWPAEQHMKAEGTFAYAVRNAGTAPCYPGGHVAFTLKDADGGIAALFTDDAFDLRTPGSEVSGRELKFRLPPNIRPGVYQVYVSAGTRTGTPKLALPLADDDGQRRYSLGPLRIVP